MEPPPPIVSYTGNRQPVVLTQANVGELAYRAFSLRSFTQSLEPLWVDPPPGPASSEQTDIGQHGGEVNLSFEIDSTGRGYVEALFRDFSDAPGELINGRYIQRFRPESGQIGDIDFSFAGPGNIEFDQLTFSVGAESVTFHGVVRIQGVDSNRFFVNLMLSSTVPGDLIYFENSEIQFSEKIVGGAPRPALDISGTVYDENQGRIDFTTLGPISDLGFNEIADYLVSGAGGGIALIADGPTTHVRPISFAFASIILDLDGDGEPETARRYTWPELAGEVNNESSVMPGPIANAGTWRTPNPDAPVKIHGLFSHDDDGDWLNFEWQLIAKPATTSVTVANTSISPYFEFTPDVPGDYVFRLRASDGINASQSSVVIRHEPSGIPRASAETVGALEIGQPTAVSTPILIDGRSAINWPYNQSVPFWHRTGFGIHSFEDTGDPASTYFTVDVEGLNNIRLSHNSPSAGAINSSAELNLAIGPAIFETAIDLVGDTNALDIRKTDYDSDGDQDLVLRVGVVRGDERILVLLNTPDGLVQGPTVPAGIGEIALGDVDNDGLIDILSATDDELLLFMQEPDHSLAAPVSISYQSSGCASTGVPADIALDNIDDAGRLDIIAVYPCDDAIVSWLQGNDGSLTEHVLVRFDNHRLSSAAFGDVNSDGRADLVANLSTTSTAFQQGISVLVSQPDGSFAEEVFFERNFSGGQTGVIIGDVDNDNRNDVVIGNVDEVVLLKQQADGSLDASVIYSDSIGVSLQNSFSLLDLNDDGLKDLFFCTTGPTKWLLVQQSNGTFTPVHGPRCQHLFLDQAEIATSLDVNHDGIVDLITITEDARGAIDERALVKVYLQGVYGYPVPVQ